MVEWEAGSNIWYQTLVLKQSLTEIQVHFPRAWILLVGDRNRAASVGCSRVVVLEWVPVFCAALRARAT